MVTKRRFGGSNERPSRERLRVEARRRLAGLAPRFADGEEVLATARVLMAAGELETADRAYRHAKKLGAPHGAPYLEHAELQRRMGRSAEARRGLEEAAARLREGNDTEALARVECALGELLRDLGELEPAKQLAERWLTDREMWDLATFLWVDCVTLMGRSLDRAVKLAVEAGNASPAMFHALLQELEPSLDPSMARAILAIGDDTLFAGWLDSIPAMRGLVERILSPGYGAVSAAT